MWHVRKSAVLAEVEGKTRREQLRSGELEILLQVEGGEEQEEAGEREGQGGGRAHAHVHTHIYSARARTYAQKLLTTPAAYPLGGSASRSSTSRRARRLSAGSWISAATAKTWRR
jgi:hypothetical protein